MNNTTVSHADQIMADYIRMLLEKLDEIDGHTHRARLTLQGDGNLRDRALACRQAAELAHIAADQLYYKAIEYINRNK